MQTINDNDVYQLQIDITSYCNAFCGACIRNVRGGPVNPRLKLRHMPWSIWKEVCNFAKHSNMHLITFNGNYGDFTSHPDIIDMLYHLHQVHPKIKLAIHTNGGARNTQFWIDLAKVFQLFDNSQVVFSIDGLEDTNHIYRRGVDFNQIMANAKTFMDHGGSARWRMIVFDYNKHQLKEASDMAKRLGFWSFTLNRSYFTEHEMDEYKEFPAGTITAPTAKEVDTMRSAVEYIDDNVNMEQKKTLVTIKSACPWQQEKNLQVNQIGEVWPCCYLSLHTGSKWRDNFEWLDEKIKLYGKDFNSLHKHSFKDIVNHDFFKKDLPHSFENSLLGICTKKCGV